MDTNAALLTDVQSWARRPAAALADAGNALTVDVEDYFQVEAFAGHIDPAAWDRHECRVERNLDRILDLFEAAGAKATFFTLGWIGERYPALVRRIVGAGHELASHGYGHQRVDRGGQPEFAADICRSKALLEDLSGHEVKGYRAPCFSISRHNLWALDALKAAGYRYSSSIYPIRHDAYGLPEAPRHAFHPFAGEDFLEIPVSSVRLFGANWPCGGGGYFRLMPLALSLAGLSRIQKREGRPCVFYFHPWEIDPHQPRVPAVPLKSAFRHYVNLSRMENKVARLLRRFSWNRVDRIFPVCPFPARKAPEAEQALAEI